MRLLSDEEVDARTGTTASTRRIWAKAGKFPRPVPVNSSGSLRGYVESEIDEWIASRIAARDALERKPAAGRSRFWEDVKAGRRLHPRTMGRLKREAALKSAPRDAWVVHVPGASRGGTYREESVAQRIVDELRRRGIDATIERVPK